uniref:X-linked retinitis pigmentosa GTPase regulator-interacting protein 1-like n=1 Tax=Pristiophorus japonicus TaxID=55135 RepID=UPI00398F500E
MSGLTRLVTVNCLGCKPDPTLFTPKDVDTIYHSQDTRHFNILDFSHLDSRDLALIVAALAYNQWFTKLYTRDLKLGSEVVEQVLHTISRSRTIEELEMENTGLKVDFALKLAAALAENPSPALTALNLASNPLEDKGVVALSLYLANHWMGLKRLNLSRTSLTLKGLVPLAQTLNSNENFANTLSQLDLSRNPGMLAGDEASYLYNFLARQNVLVELNLSGTDCAIDVLFAAMLHGCCTHLSHLNLSHNTFSHKKVKETLPSFKSFFSCAFSLSHINFSGTKLPAEALRALLQGLNSNTHLKGLHLDLSSCELRSSGAQVIQENVWEIGNISSLDISDNGFDSDMLTLLPALAKNKSIRHLSIGKNFNVKSKETIHENVEAIKAKKKLFEKSSALFIMEQKYILLQEATGGALLHPRTNSPPRPPLSLLPQTQRTLTIDRERLVSGAEDVGQQLKLERERSRTLGTQLETLSVTQRVAEQLQEEVAEVTKERDMLKEAYDKLLASALDLPWDRERRGREQPIPELDPRMRLALEHRERLESRIHQEIEVSEVLRRENWRLRLDIEQRERGPERPRPSLTPLPLHTEGQQLDTEPGPPQSEVEILTRRLEEQKRETEARLWKQDRRLDTRASVVQGLEARPRARAVRGGGLPVPPVRARAAADEEEEEEEEEEEADGALRPGESLLELHVHRAALSAPALGRLSDPRPLTFCTYALYDFETQATPLARGPRPLYDFTSRYAVRADGQFLRHARSRGAKLELHQALGSEYHTLGLAHIPLDLALERDQRLHGVVVLTGVGPRSETIGQLEYWVRMRVPKDQLMALSGDEEMETIHRSAYGHLERGLVRSQVPSRLQETGDRTRQKYQQGTEGRGSVRLRPSVADGGSLQTADAETQTAHSVETQTSDANLPQTPDSSQSQTPEASETQTTDSDQLIQFPLDAPLRPPGEKLRIEVQWLTLWPGSQVAMDESVRQLYVEYRLPGLPPWDTETPVSLRKPRGGERVYFNFSRGFKL